MSTVHKTEHSTIYYIPPHGSLGLWIHWGGTAGDIAPYRDIFPHWVSGGAPGDPNPVMIIDWKGVGITSGGNAVVSIRVKSQSAGTIGVRFILIKVLN